MKYSTHPKNQVLSFLSENSTLSYSIEDIILALPSIGKSSIYRIVGGLEKEGRVRRTGNAGRKALYQISDRECCPRHMHIKCSMCGRTEHLDENTTGKVEKMVYALVGYTVLPSTVLEGICGECRMKEKN
ncbi:MAG: Fur family transcriptional regulator [Candidatus Ornithospirochaeta sp.]